MIEQYIPVFSTTCAGVKTYLQSLIGTASYFMNFEVDGGGVSEPSSVAVCPQRDEFYVVGFKYIQFWQLSTRTLITTITGVGGANQAQGINVNVNNAKTKLCVAWRLWSRVQQYDLTTRTVDWTRDVGTNGGSQAAVAFYSPDDLWVYWAWNADNRVARIDSTTSISTQINTLTTTPSANHHTAAWVYNGKSYWAGTSTFITEYDHSIGIYGSVSATFSVQRTRDFVPVNNIFNGIYIDDNYEVLKTNGGLVGFFQKGSTFSNLLFAEGIGASTNTTTGLGSNFVGLGTYSLDCFDVFLDAGAANSATYFSSTGPRFWLKINNF
jgi:hypothetical protein